jgi:hypothetical protein
MKYKPMPDAKKEELYRLLDERAHRVASVGSECPSYDDETIEPGAKWVLIALALFAGIAIGAFGLLFLYSLNQ